MQEPSLRQRLTRLFAEKLRLEIPSPDTDLVQTGILDSLSFVDLLFQLEGEFGARFSLDDLEIDHFRSIDQIARYLSNRGIVPCSATPNEPC